MLVKAIDQAIPNYTISCFKHLMGLCKDIIQLYAKFLWGSTEEMRKIHW